jgi:hypothetical protein
MPALDTIYAAQFNLLSIQVMMLSETVIVTCLKANKLATSAVPRSALSMLPSAIALLDSSDPLTF